ncbi:MAG: primosomal protein N' [Pigmentiphaga sp.]|uniref:primosomal protein N' n=1 Tax=Pigmentiphaga sp. TaxID=1977564 RepID=UPI00299FAA8D|nr:primosomal protein N' [Pigmentiphaga sp.]MDX3906293.1 primosomal protein N' [Pigmentiphaga sp.]
MAEPASPATIWVRVALDVPLAGLFDYRAGVPVAVGQRVIAPFGRREMVGIVVETPDVPALAPEQVKSVIRVLDDLPPLPADWLKLAAFAADYYQRPLGEVMLPALPGPLRKPAAYQGKRAAGGPVARLDARAARKAQPRKGKKKTPESEYTLSSYGSEAEGIVPPPSTPPDAVAPARPRLNAAQQAAVDALAALTGFKPVLLHGVTGSGKTEVYLRAAERVLQQGRQVMLLVPEINLTPQLEQVFRRRLEAIAGPGGVAVLHSGLADGERLEAWLRAVRGQARVLLGTRLSLFTPLPDLGLIVVDEEHDPSYKQQEGLRYSARDLAIWRARDRGVPVVLGSATPSLESWHHAQSGRYLLLDLPQRALAAEPPRIRLLDTRNQPLKQGLAPQLLKAVAQRLEQGEQSLIFLNRRGYAPVLHCDACGWLSGCIRCSAYMVLHREPPRAPGALGRHELRCHHCGWQHRVPAACPDCGNQDLQPMGRGTQRLEEHLGELFPGARIARIDADSTRRKGSAQALFARMHAGEIDILVGTQMVAKGHDFQNLGFVGVLNADAMLFSHDFRAPERLFAQLMQVAGRAGRAGTPAEVYIQTGYPEQPLYQALIRHDYAGFARHALKERQSAGLPPFAYQALLTAEARELAQAQEFLAHARDLAERPHPADGNGLSQLAEVSRITLYDPVPLRVVRVANVERAQLLVESDSRPALQGFLRAWVAALHGLASASRVRWHLEVDPLEI